LDKTLYVLICTSLSVSWASVWVCVWKDEQDSVWLDESNTHEKPDRVCLLDYL